MYKCLECGHIFEEGEQATWIEDCGEYCGSGVYKGGSGCPICKGDFEKTQKCVVCGGEFLEKEIESGYCEECLQKQITTNLAYKYFTENNLVVDFLFNYIWDMDCPKFLTDTFKNDCAELFLRKALDDKILNKEYFLNLCKGYIMEDASHFAEWLEKKRKEEKQ